MFVPIIIGAIILPFLGFEFGSTINLIDAFKMIPQGLLLSIVYFIVVITPSYVFERTVLHRPGYASVASGLLAGVALVIPSMAAASNTAFEPYVEGDRNVFYVLKAMDLFKTMHVRSCFASEKPYPTLSEVAENQREFHFENTRGDVIAVWCPQYVNGINLPGWHFHYLSHDKTQGGHILGLSADELSAKLNKVERFELTLPTNPEFAARDLCEDLSAKTAAVEGVKK